MNIRKLKLALTVGLMNKNKGSDTLNCVKDLLDDNQFDTGNYLGQKVVENKSIQRGFNKQTLALQYEHLTLDLNLFTNKKTQKQILNGFKVNT